MTDTTPRNRILTAAEIDEIERRVPDGYVYTGMLISDHERLQLDRSDFENQRRDDARALIATVRHHQERAEAAERLLAGLALEHPPELATSCYCCGAFLSGPHREDCAWQLAREHAQHPKEAAQP